MYWRNTAGCKPIFPLMNLHAVQDGEPPYGGEMMLYGRCALTVPDDPQGSWYLLAAGVNYREIPDYCGGIMITAINAHAQRFNGSRYEVGESRRLRTQLPQLLDTCTVEDMALYDAPGGQVMRSGPPSDRWYNRGLRCAQLSLLAALGCHAYARNRRHITYWDTSSGFTRRTLDWLWKNARNASFRTFQTPYAAGVHHKNWRECLSTNHLMYITSPIKFARHARGMPFRNQNSGNCVSVGNLYFMPIGRDLTPPVADCKGTLEGEAWDQAGFYTAMLTAGSPESSPHVTVNFNRFYPMG